NAVNAPQDALASYTVTAPGGGVAFTSHPVPLALSVQTTLATVDMGSFDTTGLAVGNYAIDVTLTDPSGRPIPGATGRGNVQIGLPVGATLTVSPSSVPAGNGVVTNTLQINRNTALPDALALYGHVATKPDVSSVALYHDAAHDLAYVGGANGVDIVNIHDPANPVDLKTFGSDLIVQGGGTLVRVDTISGAKYLIVGTQVKSNASRFTLLIYAMADPLNPTLVNGPTGTPINHVFAQDLLVNGNTVLVPTSGNSGSFPRPITTQFGNVLSIDVSDPAAPVLKDVLFKSPGPPNSGTTNQTGGAIVDNQFAYIASSTSTGSDLQGGVGRVMVVDYSDPSHLQFPREVDIPGTVHVLTLAVQGNLALVAGSTGGWVDFVQPLKGNLTLSVLDVTDHANPRLVGKTLVTSGVFSPPPGEGKLTILPLKNGLFAVSQELVNGTTSLLLVDPSNPDNILVSSIPTPHPLSEMNAKNNLLYTPSTDGLSVYQILDNAPATVSVEVPKGTGVAVVPGSFSTPPAQTLPGAGFDTLVWQLTAVAGQAGDTITWQSTVNDLLPAATRAVTLGTTVDFASQGTTGTLQLPGTAVVGEHIISLRPSSQSSRPGAAAGYVVTVSNPTGAALTYRLSVQGVPAGWVGLAPSAQVAAHS
ncbi:MAG: hypothetical protein LC745_10090, partial [Planctomycetia bacterium]|nr:hypothetical protein [Planctomycetia bacterium]